MPFSFHPAMQDMATVITNGKQTVKLHHSVIFSTKLVY